MTFRERYLAGEIPFEKIDDYVKSGTTVRICARSGSIWG